jgi:hypothetical protein
LSNFHLKKEPFFRKISGVSKGKGRFFSDMLLTEQLCGGILKAQCLDKGLCKTGNFCITAWRKNSSCQPNSLSGQGSGIIAGM